MVEVDFVFFVVVYYVVVEYLIEYVEYVVVGFFDFIE